MARVVESPSGARLFEVDVHEDERGYCEQFEFPLPLAVCRTLTVASTRGVVRGMHFQDWRLAPLTKVVSVTAGRIEEFVVDLRQDEMLLEVEKYLLRAERSQFLVVPPWCAHGYAVVSDVAVVQYHFDAPRTVEAERVIHYRSLPIAWPVFPAGPTLSQKDREAPPAARVLAELARPRKA